MKFLDLAPIGSGESENWPTNAVFHAEQEYTNENYEFASFPLKKIKSIPRQIRNRRSRNPRLNYLPYEKLLSRVFQSLLFNFPWTKAPPRPLVARNCESAQNYASLPSFRSGAAGSAQNETIEKYQFSAREKDPVNLSSFNYTIKILNTVN